MLKTLKMVKMYLVGNFWSKSFGKKIKRVLNWRCKNGRYKIPISCFLTSKEKKRTFQENGLAFWATQPGFSSFYGRCPNCCETATLKTWLMLHWKNFPASGRWGKFNKASEKNFGGIKIKNVFEEVFSSLWKMIQQFKCSLLVSIGALLLAIPVVWLFRLYFSKANWTLYILELSETWSPLSPDNCDHHCAATIGRNNSH